MCNETCMILPPVWCRIRSIMFRVLLIHTIYFDIQSYCEKQDDSWKRQHDFVSIHGWVINRKWSDEWTASEESLYLGPKLRTEVLRIHGYNFVVSSSNVAFFLNSFEEVINVFCRFDCNSSAIFTIPHLDWGNRFKIYFTFVVLYSERLGNLIHVPIFSIY